MATAMMKRCMTRSIQTSGREFASAPLPFNPNANLIQGVFQASSCLFFSLESSTAYYFIMRPEGRFRARKAREYAWTEEALESSCCRLDDQSRFLTAAQFLSSTKYQWRSGNRQSHKAALHPTFQHLRHS
jgi:hypothetical protein